MIRAAFLCTIMAVSASAQDFRGLLPGMPTDALGAIGEPSERRVSEREVLAVYPLPYEQQLMVIYSLDAGIMSLATYGTNAVDGAGSTGGLTLFSMTLKDVMDRLEQPLSALETRGLVTGHNGYLSLTYNHESDPDFIITLQFRGASQVQDTAPTLETLPLWHDASFVGATMALRSYRERLDLSPTFIAGPRTDPIPFPLPLSEAFPPLIP